MSVIIEGGVILYIFRQIQKKKESHDLYELLKVRKPENYSKEVLNILDIATTNKTYPVGSYKYLLYKYPGDIDIFEPISGCCTFNEAKKKIAEKVQKMAKKIKKSRNIYLGDFKAGVDDRWEIYIGRVQLGKIKDYDPTLIKRRIDDIYNQKNMTKKEHTAILKLVKNKPSLQQWDDLNDFIRNKYLVRWKLEEILAGKKQLFKNKTLFLDEALTHDSVVKIDIWAKVKGRFTEITNYILVIQEDKKEHKIVLNAGLKDYIQSINEDIYKYSKKDNKNSLKLAKRLFNKYRVLTNKHDEYARDIKKLAPLFASEASRLSQLVSECTVLQDMEINVKRAPQSAIKKQIEGFKKRVRTDDEDIDLPYKKLDYQFNKALEFKTRKSVLYHLEKAKNLIIPVIEKYSASFLRKNKIKPIKDKK